MPKLHNETYQDYRERALNTKSKSFCGAKWWNATVWLGSGTTASCHHPPAHNIPLDELKESYKALHNTKYKKQVRQQMLDGEFPQECDYCWKVEQLGDNMVSDRVFKSVIYSDSDLDKAFTTYGADTDVNPRSLEIAFDATCNFACSYCNPSFSTTWMTDVKVNGPYKNMVSDGAGAFQQDGSWAQPYGLKNENNPYVEAFMEWWEKDLQHTLVELRVTGGEATMSRDFWRLMDWWKEHPDCKVSLAVNSNLGAAPQLIKRLCETTHSFKDFNLYTSNESFGAHAEYIRDGLVWDTWLSNYHMMLSEGKMRSSNIMLTINALCLFSITDFMDEVIKIKKQYGYFYHGLMSFNILRFPSFQSVLVLPIEIREERAKELERWLYDNWTSQRANPSGRGHLHQMEYDGIVRLIHYLREVNEGHDFTSSYASRVRDFKSFHMQYDSRRGKDFISTFPQLAEWYNAIPVMRTIPIFNMGNPKSEAEVAMEEGWIENPQGANPGSRDYVPPKIG